jgi:small subunit ribosomal protein S27e
MTTGFVKVQCPKCKGKHEQMIFEKPSTEVKCLVCGETLSVPRGGKGIIVSAKAEPKEKEKKEEA